MFKANGLSKTIINIFFCLTISNQIYSQSTSVFAANYFNKDEAEPPIKPGKGFNITDIYKQTRYCFTPESSSPDKLKPDQNGQKTSITVHYTQNDEEFNRLKTSGISGKVSYLNLFSLGGAKLQNFSSTSIDRQERFVFIAKVDFGTYSYITDLKLSDEAQNLKDQGKHDDFIQLYGTHYISGVKKESSIWVVLTKKNSSYQNSETDQNSVNGGFKAPFNLGVNYEVIDGTQASQSITSDSYDISIEINGPSFEKGDMQDGITKILASDGSDKISGIKKVINGVIGNISDPNQSIVSQYYFTPFNLYGITNINWDAKKENSLININEAVINISNAKSIIDKLVLPTGLNDIEADFDNDLSTFSKKDTYKAKIEQTYNAILPNLKSYKRQLDTTLTSLEKFYTSCADIHCVSESNCCAFSQMNDKVTLLAINVDKEVSKLSKVKDAAWVDFTNELLTPECQKEKIGYLTVINKSTNPYDFYEGDNFIETLPGGSEKKYKIGLGSRNFKAVQQSGYIAYATVNNRNVVINNYCDEVTIKVGFED